MPTTLPARKALPSHSDFGLLEFAKALLRFYVAITVLSAILIGVEYHFGMFKGLTFLESVLTAISGGTPYLDAGLIGLF